MPSAGTPPPELDGIVLGKEAIEFRHGRPEATVVLRVIDREEGADELAASRGARERGQVRCRRMTNGVADPEPSILDAK